MSQMSVTRYKLSVDDYHRMIEAGILTEDDKVELIRGEIIHMSPKGSRHSSCIRKILTWLPVKINPSVQLQIQDPIKIGMKSEPEPDIVLAKSSDTFYIGEHPGSEDIILVIEVAETSLETDRTVKGPLYAEAGIQEYWIINLPEQVLEIYIEPHGNRYKQIKIAEKGESIVIPGMGVTVKVDELLIDG